MPIRKSITAEEIQLAVKAVASEIATQHASTRNLVLAAIANGGIVFNEMLRADLKTRHGIETHSATIDISFYRDDIGVNPIAKEVESTQLAQDPEESTIILVDDVIFTGRSIRAALSEVHSLGRPHRIELAVLVDRGNRRLPIEPHYTGIDEPTKTGEKVVAHLDMNFPEKSHIDILSS